MGYLKKRGFMRNFCGGNGKMTLCVIRDVVLLKITKRVSYEAGFYEDFLGVAIVPINRFELPDLSQRPRLFNLLYLYSKISLRTK